MKFKSKSIFLVSLLSLSIITYSCAALVREKEMKDPIFVSKVAKDIVKSTKIKNIKVKSIAILGFISPVFVSENTKDDIIKEALNAKDIDSNRSCFALDTVFNTAGNILKEYGFDVVSNEKTFDSPSYSKIGNEYMPGLCNSGKTRLGLGLVPADELNKVMRELNIDSALICNFSSNNDVSKDVNMSLWVKGVDTAELAWKATLNPIAVESDKNIFISDIQELSKSNTEKLDITTRIYKHGFRLLAKQLSNEMLKN